MKEVIDDGFEKFEKFALQAEKERIEEKELIGQTAKAFINWFKITFFNETGTKLDIDNPEHAKALDRAFFEEFGFYRDLINQEHYSLPHSPIAGRNDLEVHIPTSGNNYLSDVLNSNIVRSNEIIREFTSQNSKVAFDADAIYWTGWLSAVGFSFQEPINKEMVTAFIIQHLERMDPEIDQILVDQGYKKWLGTHSLATVKRRLSSLSTLFQIKNIENNPCSDKKVKLLMNRLGKKCRSSRAKKAITKDILDDILTTCDNSPIGIRDRAILLFGWASGGRRRTEIVEAKIENLTQAPDGDFVYRMEHSKTDQQGIGVDLPVKGIAANALKKWLELTGKTTGPIFRSVNKSGIFSEAPLSGIDINRIVKKRAKIAGYDSTSFGAHSLRSGFITEAGRKGKPLGDVMAMSTHKSASTAMRYYQSGSILNNSASNLAD
jgi:integrase